MNSVSEIIFKSIGEFNNKFNIFLKNKKCIFFEDKIFVNENSLIQYNEKIYYDNMIKIFDKIDHNFFKNDRGFCIIKRRYNGDYINNINIKNIYFTINIINKFENELKDIFKKYEIKKKLTNTFNDMYDTIIWKLIININLINVLKKNVNNNTCMFCLDEFKINDIIYIQKCHKKINIENCHTIHYTCFENFLKTEEKNKDNLIYEKKYINIDNLKIIFFHCKICKVFYPFSFSLIKSL